jgi:UDP-N-acetylglucosamine--N-acetylmuramyl-(pentapeptide) pyrophosphoryl-undecaprenol N-acetylglucosamine transferase
MAEPVFAVVTGGGTSGHVLPALAIADALVGRGHAATSIHYVGTERGVERELVPPTGYAFTLFDVVGLQRSMSRRNLAFVPKLVRSCRGAVRLLRELRPKVVVNVGGYASFPASYAALRCRVPLVVVSYDRRPGLVSKLLARRARACAVAFPGSTLPRAELTGAPVRAELVALDRDAARPEARQALGLPADRKMIAVMCGSLGAQAVNDATTALVEQWAHRDDVVVYHMVGSRFLDQAAPERDGNDGIMYRVVGYEERMAEVYAAADVMVTRAGAGTVAELATVGVASVLVPWPGAAENHQLDNARMLTDIDAAVLLEQHDLTGDRLARDLDDLLADDERRARLAQRARAAGAAHRSGKLAALIERVALP